MIVDNLLLHMAQKVVERLTLNFSDLFSLLQRTRSPLLLIPKSHRKQLQQRSTPTTASYQGLRREKPEAPRCMLQQLNC
jgi:hypothetical protein